MDPIAANMFVFYFGIVADITPPVALAAYAGSAIAKANPMKTAFQATLSLIHIYRSAPRLEKGTNSLWKECTRSDPSAFFRQTVAGRGTPKNAGKAASYIRSSQSNLSQPASQQYHI